MKLLAKNYYPVVKAKALDANRATIYLEYSQQEFDYGRYSLFTDCGDDVGMTKEQMIELAEALVRFVNMTEQMDICLEKSETYLNKHLAKIRQ